MKKIPEITLLLLAGLLSMRLDAQAIDTLINQFAVDSSASATLSGKKGGDADIMDLFKKRTKPNPENPNHGPKHLQISAVPALGYSLQTGFAGVLSGNIAFQPKIFDDSSPKTTFFTTSIAYTQYKQVIFPLRGSIWMAKGRYNLQLDWRYMKYPSQTYGLGGYTNISDGYGIDFSYLKFHQLVLTKLKGNLYGGLGYFYDRYWNIRELGTPPKSPTDYQQYGLHSQASASGFVTELQFDNRANPINPHKGWYANLLLRPNVSALGAGSNWTSLQFEIRRYWPFPRHSQNVLAFWNFNWLTLGAGKTPYLLLPSTGWDDFFNTGRGYIQGRFRGTSMVYFEGEYRFKITRNGLLGGVLFANAQSFAQAPERRLSPISPAFGTGVRIKLNKHSGANLVIDYGIGLQGSNGISVNIGEVF